MTKPSIGLLGANGAGKTTIADYLVAEHGYRKLSFADVLRDLASHNREWQDSVDHYGYSEAKEKNPYVRQYLIDLGEHIRRWDPVYFVKALAQRITDMDPDKPWVIDDVRKQVEVNFLNDMGFRFAHVVRDDLGVQDILGKEPELGVELPTQHLIVYTKADNDAYKYWVNLALEMGGWALGSPPVHEQRPDTEGSGGSPDGGESGDIPHWCERCQQEFERSPSASNLAALEARSRRYTRQGRRHHHDSEGLGAAPEVCDGQGDALCDHPSRCGGVVLNPSGWPSDVRPHRL